MISHVIVVLLNFHQDDLTKTCLQTLAQASKLHQDSINIHTVLVQVEGDSEKKNDWTAKFSDVTVLSRKNLGFSGGNNEAIRYIQKNLSYDFVLLMNNDTRIDPECVFELVSFAQKQNTLGLYSPKIYFERNAEFHEGYTEQEKGHVIWYAGGVVDKKTMLAWHRGVDEVDHGNAQVPQKTDFCTGCCMLIPKVVIDRVGLLNQAYFLYLEDLEYCFRVQKVGGTCWYVPSAKMWHLNAGSTTGSGSELHQYYQTRNRVWFGLRFGSLRVKLAMIKEMIRLVRFGTTVQKEAVRDAVILRGGMWKGSK
ncbi:MAG: Glycosyl transferase family 2 [Microgenomates group bacterium GW2011_GWF1_44_10]|nr:MAG: Glycosyl transferase family 2 [Microgenomates group bacterium GW2011_GWF1_44_10]OGJ41411.1 MAG: hypothetical protein A2378_00800 [Candidatus Pacebacteria bacterium RIFOXYB1_FULL_44_10]